MCMTSPFYMRLLKKDRGLVFMELRKEKVSNTILYAVGILSLFALVFFVIRWFVGPNIFHIELLDDIPHFLQGNITGIKDYISKIFNLQMIESGCYRPRLLGFAVQYADIKIWMALNTIGIPLGGRWLFTIFALVIIFLAARKVCINILDTKNWNYIFLMAAIFVYVPQYIAGSYIFLRSAKVLSPAIGALLIAVLCKERKNNNAQELIIAILCTILITMDEQLIAVVMAMLGYGIINFIFSKTHKRNILFSVEVLILYFIYHTLIGKWIFAYFTPGGLKTHPHSFVNLAKMGKNLYSGLTVWYKVVVRFCHDSNILFIGLVLFSIFCICVELKEGLVKEALLFLYFILVSYGFVWVIVTEHPGTAALEEQSSGMYFILSVYLLIFALFHGIRSTKMVYINREAGGGQYSSPERRIKDNASIIKMGLIFFSVFYIVMSLANFEKYAYNHLTQGGEFLDCDIDELLEDENLKTHGVEKDFFDRLIISQEDYESFLKKNN